MVDRLSPLPAKKQVLLGWGAVTQHSLPHHPSIPPLCQLGELTKGNHCQHASTHHSTRLHRARPTLQLTHTLSGAGSCATAHSYLAGVGLPKRQQLPAKTMVTCEYTQDNTRAVSGTGRPALQIIQHPPPSTYPPPPECWHTRGGTAPQVILVSPRHYHLIPAYCHPSFPPTPAGQLLSAARVLASGPPGAAAPVPLLSAACKPVRQPPTQAQAPCAPGTACCLWKYTAGPAMPSTTALHASRWACGKQGRQQHAAPAQPPPSGRQPTSAY